MAKKAIASGEVRVRNPNGGVDLEFYEEEFLLDDSVSSLGEARQIIRRGLIIERLQKMPNFKGIRTCQVTSFESSEEKATNGELDQLLTKAAQLQCIPMNINNYKRSDYKIKALKDAIAKAEARPKKAEELEDVD